MWPQLRKLSLEDRAMWFWLRWKAVNDLFFLGYEILGWKNARHRMSKRSVVHKKIHKRMADTIDRDEDMLLICPRETLKTTWLRLKVVKNILTNPFIRNGIWSLNQRLARQSMSAIKGILQHNALTHLFPEICVPEKEWQVANADELIMSWSKLLQDLYQDKPNEDAFQLRVHGTQSRVTGNRYDAMFYDDILDDDTVKSATKMEKVRDWWSSMQPVQSYGAVEKMIGTPYHYHDLYAEIKAEKYFPTTEYIRVFTGAQIKDGKKFSCDKILYPYFTKKSMQGKLNKMGEYAFSCNYLLDVRPGSHRIFIPPYPRYDALPAHIKNYIAIDPASTTNQWSDNTGIAVAAVDTDRPSAAFFREAIGIKERPDKLAEKVVELIVKYRPHRVGIETNLSESLLYLVLAKIKDFETEHRVMLPKNFVQIRHGNITKADRLNRTIGAMIRDSRALFPREWPENHPLFVQMDMFNPNTDGKLASRSDDDIIDACGMMIQTIEHFSQAHWFGVTPKPMGITWENLDKLYASVPARKWGEKVAV
jgi:hypothetical protein